MRNPFIFTSITIFSFMAASVSYAEESVPKAVKKNAIIVKLGTFTLAEKEQTVAGSNLTFDENSTSVFDVEYTRRFGNHFTYGGEIIHYTNTYNDFIDGEVETIVATANIKKYFDVATHFQPFIGAGIGIASIGVTGSFDGNASGLAASASVGAEIPFEYVGIHLEYRYINATPDGETTFGQTAKFNVSGSALLAGVSIHF